MVSGETYGELIMNRFPIVLCALVLALTSPVLADQGETVAVFGQSLMSADEVKAHKTKLADCRSQQEREKVEGEHKDRMVQRARWKGLVLKGETRTVNVVSGN